MTVKTLVTSVTALLALGGFSAVSAADNSATTTAVAASSQPAGINDTYPGLASGGLTFAQLADLPQGTVLKASELTIAEKDIVDQIANAPKEVQDQLGKNAFFVLEQIATRALLLKEAKAGTGGAVANADERALIQDYLGKLADKVTVGDEEIAAFYSSNKDAVGGAELDKVKPQIAAYLRQQKQQELVDQRIRTLGQRTTVEVSAAWVKRQAEPARDNPVDKARSSGKPTFANFGAKGCIPCDKMEPIREAIRRKYEGKLNVVFIHVGNEQILASRYGVQAIPLLVFFDAEGKEVFRHMGFFPQEKIEAKLAEMGVK
jgi:thioredoxin 1